MTRLVSPCCLLIRTACDLVMLQAMGLLITAEALTSRLLLSWLVMRAECALHRFRPSIFWSSVPHGRLLSCSGAASGGLCPVAGAAGGAKAWP